MEQETQTSRETSAESAPSAPASTETKSPDFDRLMAASPKLAPLGGWLKCLRKPAISVEYNLTKRHIPDLDTDDGTNASANSPKTKGKNSDTMGLNGHFTIRYFDFALGILGLAIAGCVSRGCCALKRLMP